MGRGGGYYWIGLGRGVVEWRGTVTTLCCAEIYASTLCVSALGWGRCGAGTGLVQWHCSFCIYFDTWDVLVCLVVWIYGNSVFSVRFSEWVRLVNGCASSTPHVLPGLWPEQDISSRLV